MPGLGVVRGHQVSVHPLLQEHLVFRTVSRAAQCIEQKTSVALLCTTGEARSERLQKPSRGAVFAGELRPTVRWGPSVLPGESLI